MGGRTLSLRVVAITIAASATLYSASSLAQEAPPPYQPAPPDYQPAPPPPYQPAPPPYQPAPTAQPYQPAPPPQPYQPAPPPQPYQPAPPPRYDVQPPQPGPPPVAAPVSVDPAVPVERPAGPPPLVASRFRTGRILYGVGTTVGLIGSGLTLSGIVVSSIYGVEGELGSIGRGLTYGGAGASGLGMIMSATGLGLQHSALQKISADPGRGLYIVGTLFGVLGIAGVGATFYLSAAKPPDYEVISLGTSISASILMGVGGILYFIDQGRMLRVYHRLTTF